MKSIYTNGNSIFPSQVVSDAEKASWEYGEQVAQAIEQEWFSQGRTNGNRYLTTWNNYNRLRLYARGEQSIQKYKDELAIDGDLSYLNLDWKPVPILPKFVDIVVNGISQRTFYINAFAQDPASLEKRTNYAEMLAQDVFARETMQQIVDKLDSALFNTNIPENKLPNTIEELELHMQLDYKQSVAARTSFRNELWPDFKTKYEALGSTITLIDYEEMDLTVASTTSKAT